MNETSMIEPRLSVKKLAELWDCSEQHIYTLVEQSRIPHLRIGKMIRFPMQDIHEYEASICQGRAPSSPHTPLPSAATPVAPITFNGGNQGKSAAYLAAVRIRQKRAAS